MANEFNSNTAFYTENTGPIKLLQSLFVADIIDQKSQK